MMPNVGAPQSHVGCLLKMKALLPSLEVQWLRLCASGASLVAQGLRIRLPRQGTWVRSLVWEDPTCCGATKPMHHNY